MRTKSNKAFVLLVTIIAFVIVGLVNAQQHEKNVQDFVNGHSDTVVSISLGEDVKSLIESVDVSPGVVVSYDREDYTSSTQSYTFKGEEYGSIRKLSFYASTSYVNGVYTDPYSGFSSSDPTDFQYDHIIPLAYAEAHGASTWTNEEKRAYADNPAVGIDVESIENSIKGARGPAEYLPEENIASYCYTWLVIANEYDLSISQEDMNVIVEVLNHADKNSLEIINSYN